MEEHTIELATRYFKFVTTKAGSVISATILLCLLASFALIDFGKGEFRLKIDPSVERLLGANNSEALQHDVIRHIFGSDESVVITLDSNGESALTHTHLARLDALSTALGEIKGVHTVASLSTAPPIIRNELDFDFGSVSEQLAAVPQQEHASILRNRLLVDQLISQDGSVLTVVLGFKGLTDEDFISGNILETIEGVLTPYRNDYQIAVTGAPVIKSATANMLFKQLTLIVPAILLLLATLLALVFRSVRGVALPLASIFITLWLTLGAVAALGLTLNMVTTLVPPLVITLGLAYCSHILSEYYSEKTDASPEDTSALIVERVLHKITLPQVITGLTTAAGFLALYVNPLAAVKEFALIASAAVTIAVVLSLSFLPACLAKWPSDKAHKGPSANDHFSEFANRLSRFDIKYRNIILAAGIGLLIFTTIGASQIKVGSEYIKDFPESAQVRIDYEQINTQLRGANPFYVIVEGHVADTFITPKGLRALEQLQEWLEQQPEVSGSTSLVDYVREIHRAFNDGDSAFYRIPNDPQLTKQMLVFSGNDALENYVDNQYHITAIKVRANVDDTASIAKLMARIEGRLALLPSPIDGFVSGSAVLATKTIDDIAGGQLFSIAIAMLVIYIILTTLFTSWRVGLMALLPNLIPVSVYFGFLGLTGITLNPTTSLVACIVLGIAVDDTVHYLVRFNAEARNTADEETGTRRALNSVIRPVTFTSLTLVLGFLVMTNSQMHNHVQFGALAAFTLSVAWLTDIIFTPAMASRLKIVTLWDVLRLDLGKSPQHSIPLFEGLTLRQARTFALLANLQSKAANTRILNKGDAGNDIFVVIEGELEVWIHDEQKEKITLATMTRGSTIGEVGYFNSKRTANVDTLTDVRLLRFNNVDLEGLRRRRPFIAATLFRNLNLIQARRIASVTEQLAAQHR